MMNSKAAEFFRIVEEAWKLVGVDKEGLPGLSMRTLLEIADRNNENGEAATLKNWLIVFDECGAWFANLACLLMFTLRTNSSNDNHDHDARLRRVLTSLIGNISAQIIAIRRLVLSGLDVQAKQLLRALAEQLDVALLISKDPSSLYDFEHTLDGPSSNEFWHKHLSKGKNLRQASLEIEEERWRNGVPRARRHVLQGQIALPYIIIHVLKDRNNPEFFTSMPERCFDCEAPQDT